MSLETCHLGPCPILKTTGAKLSQQPGKCYNCEYRRASSNLRPTSGDSSCDSSIGSYASVASNSSNRISLTRAATAPLPNVARQPKGTLQYCSTNVTGHRRTVSGRAFAFSCPSTCSHNTTPHYSLLPSHLPHQSHPCPPCQISQLQVQGDREAVSSAKAEFPHLTSDMLVRNGRVRENWESRLTLEKYITEKRTEEKQMWCFVIRKWTQDLKQCRVLVNEEDGLGLLQ